MGWAATAFLSSVTAWGQARGIEEEKGDSALRPLQLEKAQEQLQSSPPRRRRSPERRMKMSGEVIREGELEKRSDSLFQFWKKKLVVLTKDSLSLFPDGHKRARGKELGFHSILKVDCVERTGKYIYFTIVTTDRKEIDFRCPDQSCWNASITMALIDFQNKRAIQDFKSRQELEQAAGSPERRLARAP
ncbi:pleckstrin homology-like domain family A member 2 [Chrysemys picta bellii]|uniref:pleckstrin homology-like domain family A member 2 n=1 Tax=Chrysemys picta bellii TaxID=8478 RepID=UPI001C684A55|nr:pleckstrin homology-like domain family A member 2 [Chrysemys picta bellii]